MTRQLKRIGLGGMALLVIGLACVQFKGTNEPVAQPPARDVLAELDELRAWLNGDHQRIDQLWLLAHQHPPTPEKKPAADRPGGPYPVFPKHH
jgi:hypothetical protein